MQQEQPAEANVAPAGAAAAAQDAQGAAPPPAAAAAVQKPAAQPEPAEAAAAASEQPVEPRSEPAEAAAPRPAALPPLQAAADPRAAPPAAPAAAQPAAEQPAVAAAADAAATAAAPAADDGAAAAGPAAADMVQPAGLEEKHPQKPTWRRGYSASSWSKTDYLLCTLTPSDCSTRRLRPPRECEARPGCSLCMPLAHAGHAVSCVGACAAVQGSAAGPCWTLPPAGSMPPSPASWVLAAASWLY